MKILLGLWRADSGTVQAPLRTGYLPENNPLYEDMYVTEYLRFMARLTGVVNPQAEAESLITRVGLTPERHKHIRELSKGYRQRVGLAQALIGNPELLILDEPTTGLDPNQLADIRALIRDITRKEAADDRDRPVVIISTHIMQEVRQMCDRVVILSHGEIKADKPLDQIDNLETLFRQMTNDQ
jgi:ABC-2 type transport system ATP-binding protein